jgi:hypothetical protein
VVDRSEAKLDADLRKHGSKIDGNAGPHMGEKGRPPPGDGPGSEFVSIFLEEAISNRWIGG